VKREIERGACAHEHSGDVKQTENAVQDRGPPTYRQPELQGTQQQSGCARQNVYGQPLPTWYVNTKPAGIGT